MPKGPKGQKKALDKRMYERCKGIELALDEYYERQKKKGVRN